MSRLGAKLRGAARRVRNLLGPRAAVLLYHRVSDAGNDPFLLRVRPRNFDQHMDVVRRVARPMSLKRFAAEWRAGKMPHRAVVVTFDDGYVDNLVEAKPLLAKHDVPGTVFMTAGTIGRTREFWWDDLERIVLESPTLPSRLDLKDASWQLDGATTLSDEDRRRCADWTFARPTDPTPRHKLLRGIHGRVRTLPYEARQAAIDEVAKWAGVANVVRPSHRAMTDAETIELAKDGLVEIGAHTITHPSLPALTPDARRYEIRTSRERLQAMTGMDVTSFAYPYGDHDHDTMLATQEAGFEIGCACLDRIATPRSHPFALPRLDMLDWDGDAFAAKLERWFRG